MFLDDKPHGEVKELDEVSRALLKAAEILERKGHCKGRAIGPNHSVCVSGAVSEAVDWDSKMHHDVIARLRPHTLPCPIMWNDAPERTAEEVIAKLRAVAFSS